MAVQVGHDREDVVGGGANYIGDLSDGRNMVETLQDISNVNIKPNRSGGNAMNDLGNRSGPSNSRTVSFSFHSAADRLGWGQQESKTEDLSDPLNLNGTSGFNTQLHDDRFSTPVAHARGQPQRFGDSISPIDYYNVSPNLSQFLPPPTPRRINPSSSTKGRRRDPGRVPRIGEDKPDGFIRNPRNSSRTDRAYAMGVRGMKIAHYPSPSEDQQRAMTQALGPQLAQEFAELDTLRASNNQRIHYIQF